MTTPKVGEGTLMSREELARARRAAAGRPLRPTGPVQMGIRYKAGPAAPARPAVGPQPGWVALLAATPTEALEQLSTSSRTHQVPKSRPRTEPTAAVVTATKRRTRAQRPASPAVAVTATTTAPAAPVETGPRVLRSMDAFACERCGSRYSYPAEHDCGPLTPVTVTTTSRIGKAAPGVLGSYDTFACWTCRATYGSGDVEHGCGPLTPVTVTITRRTGGEQA